MKNKSTISKWSLRFLFLIVLFSINEGKVYGMLIADQTNENGYTNTDNGSAEGIQRFTNSSLTGEIRQVNIKVNSTSGGGTQTMQGYVNVYNSGFGLIRSCSGDNIVMPISGVGQVMRLTFPTACDLTGGVNIDVGFQKTGTNVATGVSIAGNTSSQVSDTSALSYNGGLNGIADFYYQIFDELDSGTPEDTTTRINFFRPEYLETYSSSTPIEIYTDQYINSEDYDDTIYIRYKYFRNTDLQSASNFDLVETVIDFPSASTTDLYSSISTSTIFSRTGEYTVTAEIRNNTWTNRILGIFGLDWAYDNGLIVSTTTKFIVNERTSIDQYFVDIAQTKADFIASSTLAIEDVKNYCSFSTNFSFMDCLTALTLPNRQDLTNATNEVKTELLTKFPIGYFTDFISIISTSTVGSIPVINATSTLFGNAHIKLDIANSLDFILNATTSQFANESASSTQTFFEITNYYWKIICYLGCAFYILRRIIGKDLIPKI